ncbi:MAG TPA: histidine kinase [Candidatus Dormibacteraeota bacterium]|nr:histidine kinase [Candidatus Dormibacteraeota bacterium]
MGRPRLTDGMVVGFNLVGGIAPLVAIVPGGRWLTLGAVAALVVVQATALWWRRSYPALVLLTVIAAQVATFLISTPREASGLSLAFAIYAVSVYERSRIRLLVAGAAIVLVLLAVLLLVLGTIETARIFIPAGALSLVAWVIGDYVRSRRQFFVDMVARHRQEREQAAEDERLRIARELHDVVAHNVSVMAIQAGAARVSGNSGKEALESIEHSARETLSELNKLLGVLRKTPGAPDLTPQPTLNDVEALLKPARDAGLAATLRVTGERRALPAAVDLSAYRIVQEAVTNVLKHANASRVEVVADYQPDAIALSISDNGSGPASVTSNGHGLIGMRERVEVLGGDLTTGSSALGGFTVRARLPTAK